MKKVKIKRGKTGKYELPDNGYSFIVGNGTSRKGLQLQPLMEYGTLYGCNWFFKEEFIPHVLVASDEPMTKTILKEYSKYPKRNWFYTWFPKPGSGAKKAPCPEKFAAGIMASHIAAHNHKSKKVFLIGMDFFGFGSTGALTNGKLNNLYEGKKHYLKDIEGQDNTAPTYRNWQRRFQWILQNYPDTEFWHVNPFEGKSPERLRGFANFHQVTWDNLIDHLNNDAELVDLLVKTEDDISLANEPNPDNERACLERQLAGQENILYPDKLNHNEVMELRLKALEFIKQHNGKEVMPVISINNFDIPVGIPRVQDSKGVRLPTPQELVELYKREIKERAELRKSSDWTVEKQPEPELIPPPPPPPLINKA